MYRSLKINNNLFYLDCFEFWFHHYSKKRRYLHFYIKICIRNNVNTINDNENQS